MLDGIPVYKATDFLWTEAEKWLGQEAGYLDEIVGIICSDVATGRGHAFPDQTKVIDSPNGQGLRIQPLSNFGVKVFFESGIKLLADGTFVEGYTIVMPGGFTGVVTLTFDLNGGNVSVSRLNQCLW